MTEVRLSPQGALILCAPYFKIKMPPDLPAIPTPSLESGTIPSATCAVGLPDGALSKLFSWSHILSLTLMKQPVYLARTIPHGTGIEYATATVYLVNDRICSFPHPCLSPRLLVRAQRKQSFLAAQITAFIWRLPTTLSRSYQVF